MRAILINPWTKEITEVVYNGDFNHMYVLMSNPLGPKVETFTSGWAWDNGDTLYVDDEGLLKSGNRLFGVKGLDDALLAGNGLILGEDREGEACDAKSSLVEMQNIITWNNLITRGA